MRTVRVWAVPIFLLSVLVVVQVTAAPSDIDIKKDLSSYTHWTKVSEHSPMDAIAALSCAYVPQPAANDPHAKFYITVFVNPIGRKAMQNEVPGPFPVGSMIVKQKFREQSMKPELLTMMIKREGGFDPKLGNWEYLVATGDGKNIFGRGKLEQCQACHITMAKQDYVYRSYYSAPVPIGSTVSTR
jgi:hypothetical protein